MSCPTIADALQDESRMTGGDSEVDDEEFILQALMNGLGDDALARPAPAEEVTEQCETKAKLVVPDTGPSTKEKVSMRLAERKIKTERRRGAGSHKKTGNTAEAEAAKVAKEVENQAIETSKTSKKMEGALRWRVATKMGSTKLKPSTALLNGLHLTLQRSDLVATRPRASSVFKVGHLMKCGTNRLKLQGVSVSEESTGRRRSLSSDMRLSWPLNSPTRTSRQERTLEVEFDTAANREAWFCAIRHNLDADADAQIDEGGVLGGTAAKSVSGRERSVSIDDIKKSSIYHSAGGFDTLHEGAALIWEQPAVPKRHQRDRAKSLSMSDIMTTSIYYNAGGEQQSKREQQQQEREKQQDDKRAKERAERRAKWGANKASRASASAGASAGGTNTAVILASATPPPPAATSTSSGGGAASAAPSAIPPPPAATSAGEEEEEEEKASLGTPPGGAYNMVDLEVLRMVAAQAEEMAEGKKLVLEAGLELKNMAAELARKDVEAAAAKAEVVQLRAAMVLAKQEAAAAGSDADATLPASECPQATETSR
jgi:hypothetical protein